MRRSCFFFVCTSLALGACGGSIGPPIESDHGDAASDAEPCGAKPQWDCGQVCCETPPQHNPPVCINGQWACVSCAMLCADAAAADAGHSGDDAGGGQSDASIDASFDATTDASIDATADAALPCGAVTCDARTEYCLRQGGGPPPPDAASDIRETCEALPDGCDAGATCACVDQVDIGCTCDDTSGQVTVSCFYP